MSARAALPPFPHFPAPAPFAMSADLLQPVASTSTASIAGADGADEKQIAIRLSTKDPLYTIPPAKFLVPASWRRFHLSELINKVLENGQSRALALFPRTLARYAGKGRMRVRSNGGRGSRPCVGLQSTRSDWWCTRRA